MGYDAMTLFCKYVNAPYKLHTRINLLAS